MDNQNKEKDENRLIAERRQKLDELRAGGAAYPNDFRRDALAGELLAAYGAHSAETLAEEQVEVRIAGRMMSKRIMGKSAFAHIQDRSGQLQLFVQREALGEEVYGQFKRWDLGDIVAASGTLMKTKTGETSLKVNALRLLVKSLRPLPDKWHGIADQELRVRQRYVDLVVTPETRQVFRARSDIIRFIRSYLDTLRFLEVETPIMQPIPGGAAARAFETHHHALDMQLYLRIAPELYLKRLLVGGFERVYELGRVFRNEGLSTRHNPEFTMLELYQAYARYEDLMTLTESLIREAARHVRGETTVVYGEHTLDFGAPFPRVSVEQCLQDVLPGTGPAALRERQHLVECCEQHQIEVRPEYGAGKLQLELFEKLVEHTLTGPVFVTGYPAEVSPLARARDGDAFLTDRFELFIGGREIANGFSELNDPEDQAARFRAQVAAKEQGDEEAMYYDSDYIRALEYGMPPAAGLGVGVDRLVMLLTNTHSIRDVLLFPHLKPER